MFVALRLAVRRREILDARDRSTAIMLRMRSVALGTSRHFTAARQSRCFRAEADIGMDFMSTRPNPLIAEGDGL